MVYYSLTILYLTGRLILIDAHHHPLRLRASAIRKVMASFVNGLVADVRKVPVEIELKELVTRLNENEKQLSRTELSVLDTMIECLDVTSHSLGVLAAL